MTPVIAFTGHQQCEKTAIIQSIAKELAILGFRVGLIKEAANEATSGFLRQDTVSEYFAHGIETICLYSQQGTVTLHSNREQSINASLFRLFSDVDIILAEGFTTMRHVPKIEIARADVSRELMQGISGVKAVIADFPASFEPCYSFSQTRELAKFITHNFMKLEDEHRIEIFADGNRLPLKDFVKHSLRGTLLGFLNSLKFTDNVGLFEIKITNSRRENNDSKNLP